MNQEVFIVALRCFRKQVKCDSGRRFTQMQLDNGRLTPEFHAAARQALKEWSETAKEAVPGVRLPIVVQLSGIAPTRRCRHWVYRAHRGGKRKTSHYIGRCMRLAAGRVSA